MARKIILDVDPGVADTMAVCLALADPQLEVVAVTATGGSVAADQSTSNVQTIIEQLDPSHWPRIGAADLQQPLRTVGRELYGADGFCGAQFGVAELHHRHPSIKVIIDEIRAAPDQVTIMTGGPLSNVAMALQREPDLATQVGHLMIVGGTLGGPGNITPTAEFNIYCDASAAQQVFHSRVTKTLIPLDISSQVVLGYDLLSQLSDGRSPTTRLLNKILPGVYHTYRQRLGLESIYVHEVVGLMAVIFPELFDTERYHGEVETSDCLTHGTTVIDRRDRPTELPNMDVAVALDAQAIAAAIVQRLKDT